MSRITEVKDNFIGKDSSELMMELMEACNDTVTPVPDAGRFYFSYMPLRLLTYVTMKIL